MAEDTPKSGDVVETQPSTASADPGPVGVAFSQVTGVLGGFCITIMVLALTPGVFEQGEKKDWLTAVLMLAAGTYISSAGILANAQNTLALDHQVRRAAFSSGIVLFHVANMLLSVGFVLIAQQFPLPITRVVSAVVCAFATVVALANIFSALKRRRPA